MQVSCNLFWGKGICACSTKSKISTTRSSSKILSLFPKNKFLNLLVASLLSVVVISPGAFAGLELLNEDFNDNDLIGWTSYNGGNWSVNNGQANETADTGTLTENPSNPGPFLQYDLGQSWSDCSIRFEISSLDDDDVGIMFRLSGDDYYRFSWNSASPYRRLVKRSHGQTQLLAEDIVPYVVGQSYQVEIRALGNVIEVKVDGITIFHYVDDPTNYLSRVLLPFMTRAMPIVFLIT